VVKTARPPETEAEPIRVAPSKKPTEPATAADVSRFVTFAVNVSDWP
jgi:hypothetical protein